MTALFGLSLSALNGSTNQHLWLDWEAALVQSQFDKKLICLKVVQEDCHYCSEMQKEVLDQPDVLQYMSKHCTLVSIDLNKEPLPLGIKVSMTPTFFFFTADKKLIKKVPGAWKKDDFMKILKGVLP